VSEHSSSSILSVAVIGSGTMGRGIAQLCASASVAVTLHDPNPGALEAAMSQIHGSLDRAVSKGKIDAAQAAATRIKLSSSRELLEAVADTNLVIEAIPEDFALKRRLFGELAIMVSDSTILASNTSSLSLTELAAGVAFPGRVIGLHFFNPPTVMKLLEIVMAEQTAPDTLERCQAFAAQLALEPIVVRDSPGFATSRLGLVIGLEAIRMLEEGVASAADIDRAMELGYRHPMGPLKLTDLVGLDTRLFIAEHLHRELGERFRPPVLLRKMVRAGKLGQKTGQGFYAWPAKPQ
jgi:3-hydroxybutyryl-CoA dehydrogenase